MASTAYDLTHPPKRMLAQRQKPSASKMDYSRIKSSLIQTAITVMASRGGALRFGYSRDQSQYAVGVYGDGDPYTVWFQSDRDLEDGLSGMVDEATS